MSKKVIVRDKLIEAAIRNMREFGYPNVTPENIITDIVYSAFFDSMLKDNLGHGYDKDMEALRGEIAAAKRVRDLRDEIPDTKKTKVKPKTKKSEKPKPRKRSKKV